MCVGFSLIFNQGAIGIDSLEFEKTAKVESKMYFYAKIKFSYFLWYWNYGNISWEFVLYFFGKAAGRSNKRWWVVNFDCCLDDTKIRLSLPKPFRIFLKLWKVIENIRLPFPVYLLYLFARLVAQRDF